MATVTLTPDAYYQVEGIARWYSASWHFENLHITELNPTQRKVYITTDGGAVYCSLVHYKINTSSKMLNYFLISDTTISQIRDVASVTAIAFAFFPISLRRFLSPISLTKSWRFLTELPFFARENISERSTRVILTKMSFAQ